MFLNVSDFWYAITSPAPKAVIAITVKPTGPVSTANAPPKAFTPVITGANNLANVPTVPIAVDKVLNALTTDDVQISSVPPSANNGPIAATIPPSTTINFCDRSDILENFSA